MYFKVLQTHFRRKRVPGVPTKAQQSGFGGERRHSEATELLPSKGQNEGYEACADAIRRRICAVLPLFYHGLGQMKRSFQPQGDKWGMEHGGNPSGACSGAPLSQRLRPLTAPLAGEALRTPFVPPERGNVSFADKGVPPRGFHCGGVPLQLFRRTPPGRLRPTHLPLQGRQNESPLKGGCPEGRGFH